MVRSRRTIALGGGLVVPYPEPTSEAAAAVGRGNSQSETRPEIAVRSALHRRGYRFRKNLLIRAGNVRTTPDIVFTRQKIAIYVDGCFWHRCPEHGTVPKTNQDYWTPKLVRNQNRDTEANDSLREDGWTVLRVWEHDPPQHTVMLVEQVMLRRTRPS